MSDTLKSEQEAENVVVVIDPNRVRPFADQPREYFDADELIRLEVSIKQRGQIQPALVREILDDRDHDYELVDGQRRWHACCNLGIKFAAIVIAPQNEKEQYEISVAANFQRAEHTPLEIAKAVKRIYESGRSEVYIGTLFGKSAFWVNGYRRLLSLPPEFQKRLDPAQTPKEDLMPVTLALQLARCSPDDQRAMYKKIVAEEMNASTAAAYVRNKLRAEGKIETRQRSPSELARTLTEYIERTVKATSGWQSRIAAEHDGKLPEYLREAGYIKGIREKLQSAIAGLRRVEAMLDTKASAAAAKKGAHL
jgi:ParB/RepB/Spo0J family partition protein